MSGRRLRVGFDGRAFVSPAAGVRRYAWELARALAGGSFDLDLIAIGAPPDLELPRGMERADAPEGVAAPTNLGRNLTSLPLAIRRARVDLFHAPAYTAPLWGSTPMVLSVHDVSYARHPEWYPYRRDPLRRWFYRRSAHRARVILTISEFSKQEIISAYGVPAGRVLVTPLAVGAEFTPGPSAGQAPAAATAAARQREPFLLHVGDLHARRNIGVLIGALARLRGRAATASVSAAATAVKLVLVGVDRGVGEGLLADARRMGVQDAIELRGRVSDAELIDLYRGCAALVYPSRYEGFGLPLVEAMACGAPVIAAAASAIPEVTGSAAVLIDPDDEAGFAAAIARVLTDQEWAELLRRAGIARAAALTWDATASRTASAYRAAVDGT
jgi:glycosyltransferase involved in cell wall biosynthesis